MYMYINNETMLELLYFYHCMQKMLDSTISFGRITFY